MNSLSEKHILYIVKTMRIGGAEKFTVNLCEYFSKKFRTVSVVSSGGIFVKHLEKIGANHIEADVPIISQRKNILRLKSFLEIILANNSFDIIHCQHRLPLLALQLINHDSKIVYTANNEFKDIFQKLLYPDAAVGISNSIKKNLINTLFISSGKIRQINYGVKLSQEKNLNAKAFTIGFVGRIIKDKGILELIDAYHILRKEHKEINFIIRGDGDDLDEVKNKIIKLNLSDYIKIETDIIEGEKLYSDIDLLVLPTKMNEGLPISILEAAARGIPALAANKGAVTDFIKDKNTGYNLNLYSPKNIALQIKNIIVSGKLKAIGSNAEKLAFEKFNIEKMYEEYEQLYKELLN